MILLVQLTLPVLVVHLLHFLRLLVQLTPMVLVVLVVHLLHFLRLLVQLVLVDL